jgi:hypothetical protein
VFGVFGVFETFFCTQMFIISGFKMKTALPQKIALALPALPFLPDFED